MTDCRRINMWSGPRNVSTAMMYAWRQRSDTAVWDEPMYGHYLVETGIDHPEREMILAAVPVDGREIFDTMATGPCPAPVWFFKNMAHHLVGFDESIIDACDNFLLTRHPREMLPSLAAGLGRVPTMSDAAYQAQVGIVDRLIGTGRRPIVVDSRDLLEDPEKVLSGLCRHLGLSFDPAMLSWPRGPKPEDGVWAAHWYASVHASEGFGPYRPKSGPLPAELEEIYRESMPLYESLVDHAITQ